MEILFYICSVIKLSTMTINLLSDADYNTLDTIQKTFPNLTFQNKGYEGINPRNLSDEEKEKVTIINEILNRSIIGFVRFQNFIYDKNKNLKIRFQYNYGADTNNRLTSFTGVGYIKLDELKNGFDE